VGYPAIWCRPSQAQEALAEGPRRISDIVARHPSNETRPVRSTGFRTLGLKVASLLLDPRGALNLTGYQLKPLLAEVSVEGEGPREPSLPHHLEARTVDEAQLAA
jgi:hypothetical protein